MADPYASHLAVLKALKPKPKKVLEFGGGLHSTKAFLAMKSVTQLVTIETDEAWLKKLEKKFSDKRWTLLGPTGTVPKLTDFDLVFVDDGQEAQQRIQTIAFVLSQKHPRVVIHDVEHVPYLNTIRAFTDDFEVIDVETPWTAVVEP